MIQPFFPCSEIFSDSIAGCLILPAQLLNLHVFGTDIQAKF